jgi:hypothetical protein
MIRRFASRKGGGKNAASHKALATLTVPPTALYFGERIAILQPNPPAGSPVETGLERNFSHGTD